MIKSIGIIGAGIMGHGIAEVCLLSGYDVIINDVNDEILKKADEKIRWSIEKIGKRGELKEDLQAILSRLKFSTNLDDFAQVDYVIEAVKEKTEIKRQVLGKVDSVAKPECIISTNTSTIPISELAGFTGRPDRFVGLHFSNPPVIMPIVEIIRGDKSSEDVVQVTRELVKSFGKEEVVVQKDVPGFLINRLNDRVILEAMSLLEEGVPATDLDAMVRFRLNFPMGICELLDFVGIDTVYNANREMVKRGFSSRTSEILRKKVEENKLGIKTGEGFYKYPKGEAYSRHTISPTDGMYEISPLRLLSPAINEASWILRNGVSTIDDIEKAMKLAMNWPHGPLEMGDSYGLDLVLAQLNSRWAESGESLYSPDPLLVEKVKKNETGKRTGSGFRKWNTSERAFGPILFRKQEEHAYITMNRPEKLNSLNEGSWKGLKEALSEAANDPEIRSVVLTGGGRAFSSGDDIEMMRNWKSSVDAKFWLAEFAGPLLSLLANYPKPLISAVNGIAFGGGCELNMLFDIVIASEDAMFALPEGALGAMPPLASSLGFSLISRKLSRYALTGEWFSAREAQELGLVDVVVPADQVYPTIYEFTDKIEKMAPLSSQAVKSAINSVRTIFAGQLNSAANELVILAGSQDFLEGQKAFLSKRKPVWKGK